MRTHLRNSLWVGLAVGLFASTIGGAAAATRYDGAWVVSVMSTEPNCGSGSTFTLQVRDGVVSGAFNARGRVTANGSVRVSIGSGSQTGSGSGRLSGSSGSGSWRGVGQHGVCNGRWSASR